MLISRETDYALRILRFLSDNQLHSATEISESEQIPKRFIYRILKKLEDTQILGVKKGIKGGFFLIKDVEEINLLHIIEATTDEFAVNACLKSGFECSWVEKNGNCRYHNGLVELQNKLKSVFSDIKISEFVS